MYRLNSYKDQSAYRSA